MSQLTAGSQGLALLEANLSGDIDVEEVYLAMGRNEGALGVVDRAGVVDLVIRWVAFWDRASDQVGFGILFRVIPTKKNRWKRSVYCVWEVN